ncbi:MAG: hypothetical protein Q8Q39_05115 [bacterium]|nr:hypothetical protein [bacterium]
MLSQVLAVKIVVCAVMVSGIVFAIDGARAHGLGNSIEQTVGGYLIDIGYDAAEIAAQDQIRFDFAAYSATSTLPADFSDVWVRISTVGKSQNGSAVFFAGNLHATGYGPANMSYAFPKAGEYELAVRFQKNGKSIIETAVPVTVAENESASPPVMDFLTLPVLAALLIGLGAGAALCMRSSGKRAI